MSLADTEIPWYGKRVDLALLPLGTDVHPVAVELKVRDTRRAIDQAALNRYLTPTSWVATPSEPSPLLLEIAGAEGVGVLLVSDPGVYPLIHPTSGQPHTGELREHLEAKRRRVRDILSELRHG
jgi:hypothetical protein